ncbi:MAG: EAL domain-containing protein [Deltaproteobacteria bacterium]|nr:EAL domain-containing protein [Deltaproteobacteria bacterium]
MKKVKHPLAGKVRLVVAAILIPVIVSFFYAYHRNKNFIKKNALEDLSVLAGAYGVRTRLFVEMSKRRAEDFAAGPVRTLSKDALEGKKGAADRLESRLSNNELQLDKRIKAIHIISLSGTAVASTDKSMSKKDLSKEEFFLKAKGEAWVTQGFSAAGEAPVIFASAYVADIKTGRPIAVLVNIVELSALGEVLAGRVSGQAPASGQTAASRTTHIHVVNKHGIIIADSSAPSPLSGLKADMPTVEACLKNGKGDALFYKDEIGLEVAGASVCLNEFNWVVAVERPASEVLAPVSSLRNIAAATALIIFASVAAMFIFVSGCVRRLGRISIVADKFTGGDYTARVPVETRDEIGALSESFNAMAAEIRQKIEAVEKNETRISTLFETAADAIVLMDEAEKITGFNRAAEAMFGYPSAEVIGKEVEILMPERYRERHRQAIKRFLSTGSSDIRGVKREYEALRKDGTEFPISITMSPALIGGIYTFIGIIRDITERKKAEFEFKKLAAVLEHSINIIFITDIKGNIEYVNPMFETVTGYSKDEAIGQNPRILASGEVPNEQYAELWNTILSGKTWRGIYRNRKKDRGFYSCATVITPIMDEKGAVTNFLAVQEDITERMQVEERLKRVSTHDMLTGLINRGRFIESIDKWIADKGAKAGMGALILVDIDHFKMLNELYGQGAGDSFLRRVAKLFLADAGRIYKRRAPSEAEEPLISRLSGDEFAFLLPSFTEQQGLEAAEELRSSIEAFQPKEGSAPLTLSAGIVMYPEHGRNARELLSRADAAMYRAKELGRNKCHVFRKEDHDLAKLHSRAEWRARIVRAISESRFEPWFQPIMSIKDNTISHYEALARLNADDGKVILPGAFIEVAERFGLINQIDRMIIEKTIMKQARLKKQGKDISFSMNLSGAELVEEGFLDFISLKISASGADAARLTFEITETAAIGDIDRAKHFIKALKLIGCDIALDDFGVGFTSFQYLKELDVDYIKIDGSFIKKLNENKTDQLFVKAMTDVAQGLGIKTVAEFVEADATLQLLKAFGVDYAQGYLIGKPAPGV